MGLERLKRKFPNGEIRDRHPFYMGEAIRDIPGCLEACLASGSIEPMQNALAGFKPERVVAVGCGTSYNACLAVALTLQAQLGIPSVAYDAYDFGIDLPIGVDSNALVISISQSGGSLQTCLAQEMAQKLGAMTVGISGNPNSRLAKTAHLAVTDPYRLEIPLGKTRSYLSSALLGMMAGMFTAPTENREIFIREADQMVSTLHQSMGAWENRGREIAREWADLTNHYLLTGFGVQKANADEIGLKIIEVLGEAATSFGLEGFTHGPNASFRKDMGIFLFQTDARTLEKALRIANGIVMSEAALVILTDQVDAGWPEKARKIELPHLDNSRYLGLFPAAVAAQNLMYFLAIEKGMNPDINCQDFHPELGEIFDFFFPPGTH
jgi:glucosamine--fructose-6-phosphate aminotransferase (isomerizing)